MPLDPRGWPNGLPEKPAEGVTMPVDDAPKSVWEELAAARAEIAALKNELKKARSVAAHYNRLPIADPMPPQDMPLRGE